MGPGPLAPPGRRLRRASLAAWTTRHGKVGAGEHAELPLEKRLASHHRTQGRRLSKLCKGTYFERLLTRFSVPEELFGPLSLRALEQDQYVRQIKGYLPDANVAFLDEVFKTNSAVLNSLLTILNERLFDNGSERLPVPLLCLVGASNELPESEELDALYDRFLFRHAVSQVSEAGLSDLLQIASHAPTGRAALTSAALELNAEAMAAVRERAYAEVALPAEIIDLLGELRTYLQQDCEPPVYVSDRRLVKAVAMLRVSAYTCGRRAVNEFDVLLLEHVLWQRPEEAERIRDWLLQRVCKDRGTKQVQYLLSGLFGRACRADGKEPECAALATEAARLRTVRPYPRPRGSGTTDALHPSQALIAQLQASGDVAGSGELQSHAWISGTSAQRAAQTLGPLMSQMRKSQEKLLTEVVTLECALESRTEPHVLALLLPELWGRFIRTGSLEDVRPLGTQPDKSLVQQQPSV